jgi:hypothetical protein
MPPLRRSPSFVSWMLQGDPCLALPCPTLWTRPWQSGCITPWSPCRSQTHSSTRHNARWVCSSEGGNKNFWNGSTQLRWKYLSCVFAYMHGRTAVKPQTASRWWKTVLLQGRFSFYLTSNGEEATAVGSAAGLTLDDVIFSQYREQGALMWRGFSVLDMAHQCFGTAQVHARHAYF